MPPDNNIAFSTDVEEKGFADAVSLFAQDEQPKPAPAPAPTPPPQVPEEPAPDEPEKAPDDELYNKDTEPKTEPEKLEEEFIEFTGKQKERFNSVYGALKRLERENADYQRKLQQYQQVPQQQPQPAAPQFQPQYAEPKPLLANFETADQWADAVSDWSARKAETAAMSRLNVERARQSEYEVIQKQHDFINGRITEGQKKFGQREFNQAAKDIVEFAPHGSQMYNTLFDLERFPEVVVHLSKNLELADKISSLRPFDQVYELKALEKKLALAAKQPPKLPTKVEAPGNGQDQKPEISAPKLRAAAKASGQVKDWAKVFMADPTM